MESITKNNSEMDVPEVNVQDFYLQGQLSFR